MEALTYGESVSVDFSTLPEASQHALAQRGFTHVLGNEVASRVHGWAGAEGQANSDVKAVVKAWKDGNASAIAAKTAEVQADMLKALNEGTLGARSGGPRLQPIDQVKRRMAREQVAAILSANGLKAPKKGETITTKDGAFTMDQLVDRRLAHPEAGPAITKAAEKELAAKAKQIDAAKSDKEAALATL